MYRDHVRTNCCAATRRKQRFFVTRTRRFANNTQVPSARASVELVPDATKRHYARHISRHVCRHISRRTAQVSQRKQTAAHACLHAVVAPGISHHAASQRSQHDLLRVVLLRIGQRIQQRFLGRCASFNTQVAHHLYRAAATTFGQLLVPLQRLGRRRHNLSRLIAFSRLIALGGVAQNAIQRLLKHLNAARDAAATQHAVRGAQRLNQRVRNKLPRRSHGQSTKH